MVAQNPGGSVMPASCEQAAGPLVVPVLCADAATSDTKLHKPISPFEALSRSRQKVSPAVHGTADPVETIQSEVNNVQVTAFVVVRPNMSAPCESLGSSDPRGAPFARAKRCVN